MKAVIGGFVSLGLLAACSGEDFSGVQAPTPIAGGTAVSGAGGIGGNSLSTPVARAPVPPPPVMGGTLLVTRDRQLAVASDPDRDRVYLVDLSAKAKVAEWQLEPGDTPWRLVEDSSNRVHVSLRGAGAVFTVDLVTRTAVGESAVCPAPRGLAFDAAADVIHVACETGELVTLPAAGGAPVRVLNLGRDLRDVSVTSSGLVVSRFRSAQLLIVNTSGAVTGVVEPASQTTFEEVPQDNEQEPISGAGGDTSATPTTPVEVRHVPTAAWRSTVTDDGRVVVVHQLSKEGSISLEQPSAYGASGAAGGSGCGGIVQSAVSAIALDGSAQTPGVRLSAATLPVDLTVSPVSGRMAVVAAGNALGDRPQNEVYTVEASRLTVPGDCGIPSFDASGEPVAVAFDSADRLVVQSRQPAQLQLQDGTVIALSTESRVDTGHTLFHMNSGAGLACASCHPEGRDDGHVWQFTPIGSRRTQAIPPGFLATAPFHWSGDMASFDQLVGDVFVFRMGAFPPSPEQTAAFAGWLDSLEAPSATAGLDVTAIARGQTLFESEAVGCAGCHSGERLTNNQNHDVGTGGIFQVPSLVGVAARAPYLHDGCAPTLLDRFGLCGGGDRHGITSSLSQADLGDLVAYLESL